METKKEMKKQRDHSEGGKEREIGMMPDKGTLAERWKFDEEEDEFRRVLMVLNEL